MKNELTSFPSGKAAIFNGTGIPFEFIEKDVPQLKDGEILVKNLYTTLCGSDIHTYCGHRIEPAQVVLGHEIVGEILSMGEADIVKDFRGEPIKVGDRITWSIFAVPAGIEAPRPDMPQKSDHVFHRANRIKLQCSIRFFKCVNGRRMLVHIIKSGYNCLAIQLHSLCLRANIFFYSGIGTNGYYITALNSDSL